LNSEENEWASDVTNLIMILTELCDRDIVSFEEHAAENTKVSAEGIVFQGMSVILPLITEEILSFPDVAYRLFYFLGTVVQVYPTKLSSLDPALFNSICQSLQFGINDHRVNVCRTSFECLASIAMYHVSEKRKSQNNYSGLSKQLIGANTTVFIDFLQSVFTFVVFSTYDSSLLDPASNALLALIACEETNFESMLQQIIASQPEEQVKERLQQSFKKLVLSNGVTLSFDRLNRNKFKKNVHEFVNEVRGFMRKR